MKFPGFGLFGLIALTILNDYVLSLESKVPLLSSELTLSP